MILPIIYPCSSSGSANLSFIIPDTITQWETNGFCVNGDSGFGISPATALEVSQPFFLEMTLPFSIVLNEQSDVIVNVFSYLNTCAEVSCCLWRQKSNKGKKKSLIFSLKTDILFSFSNAKLYYKVIKLVVIILKQKQLL